MRTRFFALMALGTFLGCFEGNPGPALVDSGPGDVPVPMDTAPTDSQPPADTQPPGDTQPPTDNPTDVPTDTATGMCGADRPDISGIRGTEGLVIGPDGTIYFSKARFIGRMRPGQSPELQWVSLGSTASTVWGLALDVPNHRIFAGSPTAATIFVADINEAAPTSSAYLTGAGQPNGLTIGPDGALWYSDFGGGHVYRVSGAATGARTQVTTATITQANGLAFGADGNLYVDSYGRGTLLRLHLTGNMESSRDTVATGLGSPDGLAIDAMGRFYVTNQMASSLIRLDADGANPMTLQMGITSPANIEFGVGPLNCTDIYVASGGALARYEMGDARGAAVPWHRAM